MTNPFSLDGKVAVVTGAGRGLGKAIALGLASSGAAVVVGARTATEVEQVAEQCRVAGGRAIGVRADITERADCDRLVDVATSTFGGIDIAVCNAAAGVHGPATTTSESAWNKVMAISITGYFNIAQAAGREMIRRGTRGSIIALSANSSLVGYAELTAAATAKGAVDQMCRNLAVEWGEHGIRVNSINPGYTEHVPGYGDVSPGAGESIDDGVRMLTPLGRRGRVSEFVWPCVFLASEASSYITGVNLMIDGGYSVK
jgi:NAD(P)-dependent dehydrogenase (short-subunit alcohol dehydrogenase family)